MFLWFIADLAREYGRGPKQLSPECLMALKTHDWPGNVSELKNLVERLFLFAAAEGSSLQFVDN